MLDSLDRRFGRFGIPNVTLYLIIGQVFVVLTAMLKLLDADRLPLVLALAIQGEPWRFLTFMILPPPVGSQLSLMLLPFAWWIFYLMGNALEHQWGAFRYNLFLFLGFALTIAAAVVAPYYQLTNYHLMIGVFLAFAWLNPDFELLLIVIPVKVKWLALLALARTVYEFGRGHFGSRLQIAAMFITLLLFLGSDMLQSLRFRRRTMAVQAKRAADEARGAEPRHRCRICDKTDVTNPEMDFRYCSKCAGDECYCPDHIANHEHVPAEGDESKS